MATFTLEDLQKKHPNTTPKKVFSMEQIKANTQTNERIQGNQFEKEEPTGFLGKARDFATSIIGGGKLAEGAAMGIAAPEVTKRNSELDRIGEDIAVNLQKAIRENQQKGLSTEKLQSAYENIVNEMNISADQKKDLMAALPSNAEVVGSAVRLGSSLVAPTIAGGAVKASALGKGITGIGSGILRGGATGAIGGGIEGTLQGIGAGIEKQAGDLGDINVGEVAKTAAIGGGIGLATGGVLGSVFGGAKGALAPEVDESKLLDYVTPQSNELTPTQYKKALARGEVLPGSRGSKPQYVLPDSQREVALKYKDIITKDPVQTTLNISDKIASLDDDVGDFLRKNNGIFSKGELRNALSSSLDDITDVNVSDEKLAKIKTDLVDNFVKSIETNDMESLWQARKEFDKTIEKAFSGSYSLQKESKVAFRNAVQDYISQRTGDGIYQGYMSDMSNLFRLRDTVLQKASKERALTGFGKWAAENPKVAKTLGWGSLAAGGATISSMLGFSEGKGSSN